MLASSYMCTTLRAFPPKMEIEYVNNHFPYIFLSQHAPGQLWLPVYDHPASHERRCWLVHCVSQE